MDTLKRRSQEKILLTKCIENGVSFVVDNTNPTVEDRQRYYDILKDGGYEIHGYYFKSSIEDCLSRNSKREGRTRIPDVSVRSTYAKFEFPSYGDGFDKLYYVAIDGDGYSVSEWRTTK